MARPARALEAPAPRRRRRAASALEFALCLPPWLVALSVVFDLAWLVLHRTTLDAALDMGCRVGSFVDPGVFDQDADLVLSTAEAATWEAYEAQGRGACQDCSFEASLEGSYPERSVRCEVEQEIDPLIGLALGPRTMRARKLAYLEWQY